MEEGPARRQIALREDRDDDSAGVMLSSFGALNSTHLRKSYLREMQSYTRAFTGSWCHSKIVTREASHARCVSQRVEGRAGAGPTDLRPEECSIRLRPQALSQGCPQSRI